MYNRIALFPITTKIEPAAGGTRLSIAGQDLSELADQYGTPLYIYDQVTLDAMVAEYRSELAKYYPGSWGITYAGKAFLCLAMAQWIQQNDLWVDCTGAGEIYVACAGGVERSKILVHGVNKSLSDLQAAIEQAGTIVVDNPTELERLSILFQEHKSAHLPELWLRIRPGMAVDTHAYTQTGQNDSKFGFSLEETRQAIDTCIERKLPLTGLHFHLGSHFHDPAPLSFALVAVLDLVVDAHRRSGWLPDVICPGGGWAVAYHEDELPHPSVEDYVRYVSEQLAKGCQSREIPLPRLHFEPGRSLVARAGVAIYRVGAVKQTRNRHWLLIDGGMSDNIRPGLYGARYSALPVKDPDRSPTGPVYLGGPVCESSDIMAKDLLMPDVQPGELLAVPVAGAYHISMGSNYNGACKPAVLWLDDKGVHLIQRRETIADLARRDILLPD